MAKADVLHDGAAERVVGVGRLGHDATAQGVGRVGGLDHDVAPEWVVVGLVLGVGLGGRHFESWVVRL